MLEKPNHGLTSITVSSAFLHPQPSPNIFFKLQNRWVYRPRSPSRKYTVVGCKTDIYRGSERSHLCSFNAERWAFT